MITAATNQSPVTDATGVIAVMLITSCYLIDKTSNYIYVCLHSTLCSRQLCCCVILLALAPLASVTSKSGDRKVHGIIEEFRQDQCRVWQC